MKHKYYNYNDPHLERHIKAEGEKLINEGRMNGIFTSEIGKPPSAGGSYHPLVGDIVSGFNELLAYADNAIQGSLNGIQGLWDKQVAGERKQILNQKIIEQKDRLRAKRADLGRIPVTYPWKWYWWIQVGVWAITGVEALYTTKSFQLFGDSLILSVFIAIALWVSLYFTSHNLPKAMNIVHTPRQKRWLALGITGLLYLIFHVLGIWRLEYLKQVSAFLGDGNSSLNGLAPWQFALINLFLLGIATFVAHTSLPTKADRTGKEKHDKEKAEVSQIETEIRELEHKLEHIDTEVKQTRARRAAIIKYAKYCENWIHSLYEKAIAAFKQENIIKRKDGKVPDCFREDPPDLRFSYDDIDI